MEGDEIMADQKKKDLGVIIAMGGPKKMPVDEELEGEAEGEADPGAFEQAASEAFAAAKADDEEGFASALRLAIEALI